MLGRPPKLLLFFARPPTHTHTHRPALPTNPAPCSPPSPSPHHHPPPPYLLHRSLYPNVDFYSGIVLRALGIPVEMYTVLFAMARTVGWVAQWKEMVTDATGRITRPRQIYTGEMRRKFVPVYERQHSGRIAGAARGRGGGGAGANLYQQRATSHLAAATTLTANSLPALPVSRSS